MFRFSGPVSATTFCPELLVVRMATWPLAVAQGWVGLLMEGDVSPDIITTAKGLTSSYAPMGAVLASDKLMEPFLDGTNSFAHGFTWGGHPMCAAVADSAGLVPLQSQAGAVNRRCFATRWWTPDRYREPGLWVHD